jgi:hypothetical protein
MKSKNPQAFWLRWMGASALHVSLASLSLWLGSDWLFTTWYGAPLFNFVSGTVLAALHYWAMPLTMRPNARRWFSISIFSQILAVSIHTLVVQSFYPNPNPLALWFSLFLLPALAQAWTLSEHFKKTWIFTLAAFVPFYLLFAPLPFPEIYQNFYAFVIFVHLLRALAMGGSLIYLQRYQRKESNRLDAASHERLALRDDEDVLSHDETIRLAQQKQS